MKLHRKELFLSISCFFLAFLLATVWNTRKDEALATRIAPEIIRFHILADSNQPDDQALKLQVRNFFLDHLYKGIGDCTNKGLTIKYIQENTDALENTIEFFMKLRGYDYSATIEICQDYFPQKSYGDYTFPCGVYDAVRVKIGSGKGRNWWCVLYPQLCFTESTYAVLPEDSQAVLEQLLTHEDYQALLDNHVLSSKPDRKIRLKLWECIEKAVNSKS